MRKLLTLLCFISVVAKASDLPIIIDPVVNANPPGTSVTAGYMTLSNKTDADITITGASSPTVPKVEIHLSSMKDDVASMEKQDSVTVKAGESLVFEHGSYHLMLMDLTEPLKEEQMVDIIIESSAGDFLIEMPVKKIGAAMHKHGEMNKQAGERKSVEHTGIKPANIEKSTNDQAMQTEHNMQKDGDAHKEETKVVH